MAGQIEVEMEMEMEMEMEGVAIRVVVNNKIQRLETKQILHTLR